MDNGDERKVGKKKQAAEGRKRKRKRGKPGRSVSGTNGRKEDKKKMSLREKMLNKMAACERLSQSSSHVECTCARSIVSVVYFGVGARLGQVSVGRAIQAAVTHSVQVAAICPKTTRR